MLPFLKPRKQDAGIAIIERKPDEKDEMLEHNEDEGLLAAASDLMTAIHNKDVKAVKAAMQAFFELSESMPHDESVEESKE